MTYIHKSSSKHTSKRKNYVLKVRSQGQEIIYIRTHSIRPFLTRLRSVKNLKESYTGYLRVSYGKEKDAQGVYRTFYNDGIYSDYENLVQAFNAFNED